MLIVFSRIQSLIFLVIVDYIQKKHRTERAKRLKKLRILFFFAKKEKKKLIQYKKIVSCTLEIFNH